MAIRWSRGFKFLGFLVVLGIVLVNVVLYNHAYYFTHFVDKDLPRLTSAAIQQQPLQERLKLAFFGVEIPKSQNKITPSASYETITLAGNPSLEAWYIPTEQPVQGVVVLFHGYTSQKSSQLGNARTFRKMGYHTLLVDFRGHGGSDGLHTTIGYHEAEDVQRAYQYIQQRHPTLPIVLMGSSMGAVSILKAIHDHSLKARALILECPFESMRTAICRRFKNYQLPTTLLPDVLLFWGSWQNDMEAQEHNSVRYAQQVEIPTLLLHGAQDKRVDRSEADAIIAALAGPRELVVLEAGHDQMSSSAPKAWTSAVWHFLEEY